MFNEKKHRIEELENQINCERIQNKIMTNYYETTIKSLSDWNTKLTEEIVHLKFELQSATSKE